MWYDRIWCNCIRNARGWTFANPDHMQSYITSKHITHYIQSLYMQSYHVISHTIVSHKVSSINAWFQLSFHYFWYHIITCDDISYHTIACANTMVVVNYRVLMKAIHIVIVSQTMMTLGDLEKVFHIAYHSFDSTYRPLSLATQSHSSIQYSFPWFTHSIISHETTNLDWCDGCNWRMWLIWWMIDEMDVAGMMDLINGRWWLM